MRSGPTVKIDGGGGSRWGEQEPRAWLKQNGFKDTLEEVPALGETIAAQKTARRAPPPAPPPASTAALRNGRFNR